MNAGVRFLAAVTTSLVVVLHTVLQEPSRNQRRIVERLADRADHVVVQSKVARQWLREHGRAL